MRAPDSQAGRCRDDEDPEHQRQRGDGGADDVEEVRAGLNANSEGEDGQAKGSQRGRDLDGHALGHAPGCQDDPGEQHSGGSQTHPLDLDMPDEHAEANE